MKASEMAGILENTEALVLAAGKGTRMRSERPKVLHEVCGRSLIRRTLDCLIKAGVERVSVVLGSGKEQVQAELDKHFPESSYIEQTEQNGTGHAVQVALGALSSELILILPGDVPLLKSEILTEFLSAVESEKAELAFLSFEPEDPAQFGRVLRNSEGRLQEIKEARDCSEEELEVSEVNSGIYLVDRLLLEEALGELKSNNAQGELYLTDIVSFASSKDLNIEAFLIEDALALSGANTRVELSELEAARRFEIASELQISGVTIEDPEAVYIDEGIQVGKDSFLGAGVHLKGESSLGAGVRVEAGSVVTNSHLADGTHVKPYSVLENAKVGAGSIVGPYARLRPGSVLEAGVKVGNFVEIKKSHLETGVKAGHLSYLGDAHLGKDTNVGAGTITCNYDGENKHHTKVGAGSFLGSNTALVAPVELGAKTYVGAGSVVTKDVPEGSLVVARARQVVKKNWSPKKG